MLPNTRKQGKLSLHKIKIVYHLYMDSLFFLYHSHYHITFVARSCGIIWGTKFFLYNSSQKSGKFYITRIVWPSRLKLLPGNNISFSLSFSFLFLNGRYSMVITFLMLVSCQEKSNLFYSVTTSGILSRVFLDKLEQ